MGGALSVYLHKTQTTAIRGSHCIPSFSSANLRHACICYFFQSRGTQLSAQQNYLQSFPQMVPLSGTPFPGSLTLLSEKGPELQGWDQSEAREVLIPNLKKHLSWGWVPFCCWIAFHPKHSCASLSNSRFCLNSRFCSLERLYLKYHPSLLSLYYPKYLFFFIVLITSWHILNVYRLFLFFCPLKQTMLCKS